MEGLLISEQEVDRHTERNGKRSWFGGEVTALHFDMLDFKIWNNNWYD